MSESEIKETTTEVFFIEDSEFFVQLSKKITDKANIDDFSFPDAIKSPDKVKIRKRNANWESATTSKRGNIKGKKGDYLLLDPSGNKLKVTGKTFETLYKKIIED